MAKKEEAFHHRASLKQKNKAFKRRHATKNSMRDKSKGRTSRASIKGKVQRTSSRADRRNTQRTLQRAKRTQQLENTRMFTGRTRAAKTVLIVPLCPSSRASHVARHLFAAAECQYPEESGAAHRVMQLTRFKQTIRFVEAPRSLLDILDAAAVADYMILALSATEEVDAFGERCLAAIQNQGHAAVFPVITGLAAVAQKRQAEVRKSLQSFTEHFFPDAAKPHCVETPAEALAVLRMVATQVPRAIKWRDTRAYVVAEKVEFERADAQTGRGLLAVTGVVRGAGLSANRLVHVPGFGDFQIDCIYGVPADGEEPQEMMGGGDNVVLDRPDPELQDSLVAANEPDQLANEQTWPEDDEMAGWDAQMAQMEEDEERQRAGGRVVRVPRGMSSYQAAWIPDEPSDASDSGSDDDDSMMGDSGSGSEGSDEDEDSDDYEEITVDAQGRPLQQQAAASDAGSDAGGTADDLLPSAEQAAIDLRAYLSRQRESRDDAQFPDELDTPMDQLARQRFARFRGLQSFRTSPWDAYENLPLDYARIFQFANLRRTQQRVLRLARDPLLAARPGVRVRLVLRDVPLEAAEACVSHPDRLFAVYALHPYEHQMSLVHFTVMRTEEYREPVRSKDPLVVHVGFRRYSVQPVFSQHVRAGANGVHKFERFLRHGVVSVASVYAPIQLGAVPVSVYLPGTATLVATGTTLDANPSRIIAKRIVLTGAPFKIHKRGAVVRYMFFNPEDVMWFKPVQLHTKFGRIGHISESLGTHGYMKCIFDGPIKQMDTVCMNLYKRVFPKWTTEMWSPALMSADERRLWEGPVAAADDDEDVSMEP
ncbi:ribosome biogenesis protein tsr1 [Coemansia erecta]|uniref:Ribosome biogenesis protein tsr1 n=1 Tax=Coemansia erecta TaxID=147472 RepID=A0A9W7Y5I8_9FUNG|nr:ribosome biogenesis protein tsr1 [Coemansia erecta]